VDRRPRHIPEEFRYMDTAKEVFAEARRLPALIAADPIVNAVDDEISYRITKLRITRRYPPNGGDKDPPPDRSRASPRNR
jgi:hypothetical protein